jgi:RNA polymerase sigma-70 factor (ECF subfamily)
VKADTQTGGLESLYYLYRADLLRFLVSRTGDPAEAEEIIQELWFKTRAARPGPVGNARAYLYRMAQNLVLDRLRERQRRALRDRVWSDHQVGHSAPGTEVLDRAPTAEEELVTRGEVARLRAAIKELPDGARRALRLHKIDGLSHGEVAERLGISRSGVEKHMAVAMKYLRRSLLD